MTTPQIRLKPRAGEELAAGRLWVFRDAIQRVAGELTDGEAADVLDAAGRFLGRGLVSLESSLFFRLYTRRDVPLDRKFFRARLAAAMQRRRQALLPSPQTNAYRMVFAEADGLPGLIVDRFADVLVLSAQTVGIDRRKGMLAQELLQLTRARGVLERSDVAVRRQEGLEEHSGTLAGEPAEETCILENGVRFAVDLRQGMKTGHFCDQRENRLAVRPHAQGARALDAFSYTGGFALNLAVGGAASITAVDQSAPALEALRRNASLNELDPGRFTPCRADVFPWLREAAAARPRSFDLVVLDPPGFARRREEVAGAVRGYKEVNLRGLKLVRDGGHLLTCSCTQHVSREEFRRIVEDAARDAGRRLLLVRDLGQPLDHPVWMHLRESQYLKALLVEVHTDPFENG